jgi:hypothetical protein
MVVISAVGEFTKRFFISYCAYTDSVVFEAAWKRLRGHDTTRLVSSSFVIHCFRRNAFGSVHENVVFSVQYGIMILS